MKKLFLPLLLLVAVSAQAADKNPVLSIEGGKVQGVLADDHPEVFVYRGIPYAAPPIRENRWKAPQPVLPWKGVKICDTFGRPSYQAIQYTGGYYTEWGYGKEAAFSEDCLYLNVWTKAPGQVNKKLPVALWIHGGGYAVGWGFEREFDGVAWAQRDVIMVTFHYRLGGLGFLNYPELSAEDPDGVSGNYGFLDQIAALKWVKKNIAAFGGDPDNITIFGQSAGGASVRNLCISPMSKGMVAKAIIQSGGGLSDLVSTNLKSQVELDELSKSLFEKEGYNSLAELRAECTDTIFKVTQMMGAGKFVPFRPHQDGVVLPQSFEEATYSRSIADIPYMIGYTAGDIGNMRKPILNFAAVRDSLSEQPTYCYVFDRELPNDGRPCLQGAFHSCDLWYVFHTLGRSWRPFTEADFRLSDEVVDAWTNFAKYGNPNGKGDDAWKPTTREQPFFYSFNIKE